MFFNQQSHQAQDRYKSSLKVIGSLSRLFSDAKEPYLYYRVAEKIFCQSFHAIDLSRSDVALDAHKDLLGIGLKTFLENNQKSFQKIAEFNKDKPFYTHQKPQELIHTIATLRNQRIAFTQNLYGLKQSIYHCVVRGKEHFTLHEEKMDYIDIEHIGEIKVNQSSIKFNDGLHDYSFNLSKSTLMKRFITTNALHEFEVKVLLNPLKNIEECLATNQFEYGQSSNVIATLYLPLYGKNKKVYERSGLNQWNAKGRERHINEVYIPIPTIVHQKRANFFPTRDEPFDLKLPNGKILKSKVCQAGDKALMSYSNRALGAWILREVLSLKEGELLTYEKLQTLGVDAVRIDKLNDGHYEINFAALGSFERFIKGE